MEPQMDVMAMWFGESAAAGLLQSARRQGWPVVRPRSAREALTVVLCRRPRLVVTQLPPEQGLGLAVIAMLHKRGQVTLVAVAARHDAELERRVRVAGAQCYLPADASAGELVWMVSLLLKRKRGPEHPRDAPVMKGGVNRCMMYF